MIKTIKILGIIFFTGFVFFIGYYANRYDIPKQFSNAQEAFSNLISTLITDEKNNALLPVSLVLANPIFPLGDDIILQYNGEAQSFKDLSFDLKNNKDEPVSIKATLKEDKFLQIETSKKISPGKYKLMIKQAQKELINSDVYLDTIVINNQQFQYTTGENYISDIIFFDDKGKLFCKNKSSFAIINTLSGISDTLQVKEAKCDEKNSSPYRLIYTPKTTGTYVLKNPIEGTSDSLIAMSTFNVTDTAPMIAIKRESPTFVSSGKEYEVKITISANENFEGVLTDFIPAGFVVINSSNFSLQPSTVLSDVLSIHLRKPFNGDFPVTLKFGERSDDIIVSNGYKDFGIKAHDGIDFALPENTPVLAVDDGKVIEFPSKLSAYGNNVVLEHLWGGRTFYGHLSRVNVQIGQKVGKGEVVGFSGQTGLVTGPHLHFGLDLKNSDVNNGYLGKIDPTQYISDNNDLNVSTQKLTWNVFVNKGEKKELGYVFKIPEDDYGYSYFELGPINIVNKNAEVVFKDSQRWTLIKE